MKLIDKIDSAVKEGVLDEKYGAILLDTYHQYNIALKGENPSYIDNIFDDFFKLVYYQCTDPVTFESYHRRCTKPYDYYSFGLNFFVPLVDLGGSKVYGLENIDSIRQQIERGDNVILFANHQTEGDPQIIDIVVSQSHPGFVRDKMMFVAGARVLLDALAAPFSIGLNLLCIYSKRHIEHPPEEKASKQMHNKRTMRMMGDLLKEGGKCIYVAPSGGRDRLNDQGEVEVAPFDQRSIDLFELMASRSDKTTHFYPLSLVTYNLLPPPSTVERNLGEQRLMHRCGVMIGFGKEIDMTLSENTRECKAARTREIHQTVKQCHDFMKRSA